MKTTDTDKKRSPLKEKPLRLPGQSDSDKIRYIEFKMVGYIAFGVIVGLFAFNEWFAWFMHSPRQPVVWTCLAFISIVFCAYKCRQLLSDKRKWELGRQGEIEVGHSLEELRKNGYVIFHDILAGGFNIDHVVIAPSGIFAIETKTWSRNSKDKIVFDGEHMTLNGQKLNPNPAEQARINAKWLNKELQKMTLKDYPVKPVVVFPGWWVTNTKENTDIWVLNPGQLDFRIGQEPTVLSQVDMQSVVYFLSRYIRNL